MQRSREDVVREVAGYVLVLTALLLLLALLSYHPLDPSPFSAGSDEIRNLLAHVGAAVAGVLVTLFGLPALLLPAVLMIAGWRWLRGHTIDSPSLQAAAWSAATVGVCGLLGIAPGRTPYRGGELAWGGDVGRLTIQGLTTSMGATGAVVVCAALALAGTVLGFRGSLAQLFGGVGEWFARKRGELAAQRARRREERLKEQQRRDLLKRHRDRHPPPPPPPAVWREVEGARGFAVRRVEKVQVVEEPAPTLGPPPVAGERPRPRRPAVGARRGRAGAGGVRLRGRDAGRRRCPRRRC